VEKSRPLVEIKNQGGFKPRITLIALVIFVAALCERRI
jgi:hypothetical protein